MKPAGASLGAGQVLQRKSLTVTVLLVIGIGLALWLCHDNGPSVKSLGKAVERGKPVQRFRIAGMGTRRLSIMRVVRIESGWLTLDITEDVLRWNDLPLFFAYPPQIPNESLKSFSVILPTNSIPFTLKFSLLVEERQPIRQRIKLLIRDLVITRSLTVSRSKFGAIWNLKTLHSIEVTSGPIRGETGSK